MRLGDKVSAATRRWRVQRYERQQMTNALRDQRSVLRARMADEDFYGVHTPAA